MAEQGRMNNWLAERVGVDKTQVSRWRSGKHVPAPATREAIAAALGLDVGVLWPSASDHEAA